MVTFNVRGLRSAVKRRSIFRHLHTMYRHSVVMLQETHSRPEVENVWRAEWGGHIVFSHGSDTAQAGVALMFPPGYTNRVNEIYSDDAGRLVCVEVGSESGNLLLLSVYAPAVNDQRQKCEFLDLVRSILLAHSNIRTIAGGDFNIKLGTLDSDQAEYSYTRSAKNCGIS